MADVIADTASAPQAEQAAPAQANGTTVGGFANVNLNGAQQQETAPVESSASNQDVQGVSGEKDAKQYSPDDNVIGGEDNKPLEKPNDNVPEKYSTFEYNGEPLEADVQESFGKLARTLGYDQAQAQSAIKVIGDYIQNSAQETYTRWGEETRTDPEIGGRNLASTQRFANKALSNFFSPQAQELMKSMGLFNNKDFIKGMRRIGEAISMDTPRELIGGNSQAGRALRENPLKTAYSKYDDPHVL